MNIMHAIILGIVEGLTEFLPVSSTFHLIFTGRLLQLYQTDFLSMFQVFIQSGAILAVVILFFKDLWEDKSLIVKAGVAFIPTGIVGLLLHDIIKGLFEEYYLLIGMFTLVGFIFLGVEYLIRKEHVKLTREINDITWKQALIVGLIQSIAIIPGVSRSGAVLVGMMLMRYKRDEAAKFSFILSIPTIFIASFYDLFKMRETVAGNMDNVILLIVGFIAAFISAYFVVRWFIDYLKTNTLIPFAIYRFVLAAIIIAIGLVTMQQ